MGRRWGKTVTGGGVAAAALSHHAAVAWVAPTYKNTRPLWRWIVNVTSPAVQKKRMAVSKGERVITTDGGGFLGIYSADNIDSIRGEAFNVVVCDEAARLPEDAWQDAILPTLADADGDALLISTPKGKNWFWYEYQRGQAQNGSVASWNAPTSDNPLPNIRRAFDMAQERVSSDSFRQEWLAQFVEGGLVFRNIAEVCTLKSLSGPVSGSTYIAGVDVANERDYTVATVLDERTGDMVAMDRFHRVGYPVLEERLVALYQRWGLTSMTIESNSIGQPVIDHLQRRGLYINPWLTTNATKQKAIQELQAAFEHRTIRLLDDADLRREFETFEGQQLAQSWRYGAPSGLHDDIVMSVAIAWQAVGRPSVDDLVSFA